MDGRWLGSLVGRSVSFSLSCCIIYERLKLAQESDNERVTVRGSRWISSHEIRECTQGPRQPSMLLHGPTGNFVIDVRVVDQMAW